jgi:5-formyltetrahydrofolate cyclo-ligase
MASLGNERQTKAEWRVAILARRAEISPEIRQSEAQRLSRIVDAMEPEEIVCAYVPIGNEPGSLDLVDRLRANNGTVLLPVVTSGALNWAEYQGRQSLRKGRLPYLLEPDQPLWGVSAIAKASTVLIPALAIDHSGVRLGRGAGHYDRSLVFASPSAKLVAVVRDDELLPTLPVESHDVLMTGVLTPGRGVTSLPLDRSNEPTRSVSQ